MTISEPFGDRHSFHKRFRVHRQQQFVVERIDNAHDGCAATLALERINFEARTIELRKRCFAEY